MSLDPCSSCCCEIVSALNSDGSLPAVAVVGASLVEISAPIRGRGFTNSDYGPASVSPNYSYTVGQPPQGYTLSSSATVTLYDNVAGSMTSYLEPLTRGSWYAEEVYPDEPRTSTSFDHYIRSIGGAPAQVRYIAGGRRNLGTYTVANLSAFRDFQRPGIEDELPMVDGIRNHDNFHVTESGTWKTPPALTGYLWRAALTFGSSEMWVVVTAETGQNFRFFTTVYHSYRTRLSSVFPNDDGSDDQTDGVFTLSVYRPDSINWAQTPATPPFSNTFSQTSLPRPPDAAFFAVQGRSPRARGGYSNTPLHSVVGQNVKLYRNGVEILSGVRPTAAQVQSVASADGLYFLVSDVDGLNDDPSVVNAITRAPALHTTFESVVVDRVQPAVGLAARDDAYLGFIPYTPPTGAFTQPEALISTKPLAFFYPGSTTASTLFGTAVDDEQTLVRPDNVGVTHTNTGLQETHASYRVTSHVDNTFFDYSGNKVKAVASYTYKLWKYENNSTGSTSPAARLTQVNRHPIRQSDKVLSVSLTFNRRVSGEVTASQFRVYRDNEIFASPVIVNKNSGGQAWEITLPEGLQTENCFILVEYDPAGELAADDFPIYRFKSYEDVPAFGVTKARYVYMDDQGRERWLTIDVVANRVVWVEIEPNGYPIKWWVASKPPWTPEPCILVARSSWLMALGAGSKKVIDTSWSDDTSGIGRYASLTQTRSVPQSLRSTRFASTDIQHNAAFGVDGRCDVAEKVNREGFTPCVPQPSSPPDDCSFFGLSTTIYPCPPADVSQCASPRVPQKHSSAIRGAGDCTSIKVWLSAAAPVTLNQIATPASVANPIAHSLTANPFVNGGLENESYATRLLLLNGTQITTANSFNGKTLCQNTWMGMGSVGSAVIPVGTGEILGRTPNVCGESKRMILLINGGHTGFDGPVSGVRNDRVRAIEAGRLTAESVQATVSAVRGSRTYPALKTTTLGDLILKVVFRVVMRYEVDYADYDAKWPPIGVVPARYDEGDDGGFNQTPCQPGPLLYTYTNQFYHYWVQGAPTLSNQGVFLWPSGFDKTTRTVSSRFVSVVYTFSPLSKAQEDRFSSGEVVSLYSGEFTRLLESINAFPCTINFQKTA